MVLVVTGRCWGREECTWRSQVTRSSGAGRVCSKEDHGVGWRCQLWCYCSGDKSLLMWLSRSGDKGCGAEGCRVAWQTWDHVISCGGSLCLH
ncbi:hypothetical protein V6N13_117151 [Hibiscus sabdariffa]|uniref:Uncharacterized protein n=1 Tax=Hibiscus sabdariffa TaxID=183260 RepID=A0ABR2QHE6_9ROSI